MTRSPLILAAFGLSVLLPSAAAAPGGTEGPAARSPEAFPPAHEGGAPSVDAPLSEGAGRPEPRAPAEADGAGAAEPSASPQGPARESAALDIESTAGAAALAVLRRPKKQVYGWIEDVLIDPQHALKLPAKLDTGADTTSLDARNIRRTRREGEDYVRFVVTEPATGESVELEKPFVRAVRIKATNGYDAGRRVVVRMRLCIGDRSRSVEVNLVDRAHYDYPLLLGRNALRDVAVIDPNLRRTREPSCWSAAQPWAAAQPPGAGGSTRAAAGVNDNEIAPDEEPESNGGATASCENAPMC
jgi:hypothetical protein